MEAARKDELMISFDSLGGLCTVVHSIATETTWITVVVVPKSDSDLQIADPWK